MSFEGTIVKLYHWRPSKSGDEAYIEYIGIITKRNSEFHHEVLLMDSSRENTPTNMINFRKLKDWELDDKLLGKLRFSRLIDTKFDSLDVVKKQIQYLKETYDKLEKPRIKGYEATVYMDESHLFDLNLHDPLSNQEHNAPLPQAVWGESSPVINHDSVISKLSTSNLFNEIEKRVSGLDHTKPNLMLNPKLKTM